jgi:hypothetical protein
MIETTKTIPCDKTMYLIFWKLVFYCCVGDIQLQLKRCLNPCYVFLLRLAWTWMSHHQEHWLILLTTLWYIFCLYFVLCFYIILVFYRQILYGSYLIIFFNNVMILTTESLMIYFLWLTLLVVQVFISWGYYLALNISHHAENLFRVKIHTSTSWSAFWQLDAWVR